MAAQAQVKTLVLSHSVPAEVHLLYSDSEQNINVPERKPIRTHRFKLLRIVFQRRFRPPTRAAVLSAGELVVPAPPTFQFP